MERGIGSAGPAGLAAGLLIAVVPEPVGAWGAVFLLPVQLSVFAVPSPAVTPTNLLYNVGAGPGALLRYLRTGALHDASGTWSTPGPAGGSGLPALGEKAAQDRISYRAPDLDDSADRARYPGKRTAVIGSGASAFTALAALADLAKKEEGAGTHAVWILRRGTSGSTSGSTFGGGEADRDVYLVGMKSYGRAPTFLAMAMTGYEQVRSIAAHLAGEHEAAERVELAHPETGGCGGTGLFDQPETTDDTGGGCCAAPATLTIGVGVPTRSGGC